MRRSGLALLLSTAVLVLCPPAALAAPCDGTPSAATFTSGPWHAEDLARREIARSPQYPSYASWAGAWQMPDDSLMVAFTQAIGEPDPSLREPAPAELKERLGVQGLDPRHDFWGLRLTAEYRRSTDGGRTWVPVRSDGFHAVYPHAYAAAATTSLSDGTILRRVNGWDLQHDGGVPHTAYLQRLAPGATAWTSPEVLLDPERFTYQLGRIRHLRDGCLIAIGQVWELPAGRPDSELKRAPAALLLMVSDDDGRTWKRNALPVPADGPSITPNEWDVAELPSGDLLAVFRTTATPQTRQVVRRQALLERVTDGWRLTDVRDAPFPPSGHPELLATREGLVLHIAGTGVHWTGDAGATWQKLTFHPTFPYESRYYPVSLQAADGLVRVFSHTGWDAGFAEVDQAIVADEFRLTDRPLPNPPDPPPATGAPSGEAGTEATGTGDDGRARVATSLRASVDVDGRRVTVRGALRRARRAGRLPGDVRLRFRHVRGKTQRRAIPAARRFRATVKLRRRGRWHLRVTYAGGGRYAPATIGPAVLRVR